MKYIEGYVIKINEEWLEITGRINGENQNRKIIVLEKTIEIEDALGNHKILKVSDQSIKKGCYGYFFFTEDNQIESFYNNESDMKEKIFIEKNNNKRLYRISISDYMYPLTIGFIYPFFLIIFIYSLFHSFFGVLINQDCFVVVSSIISLVISWFLCREKVKSYKKSIDRKINEKYDLINSFKNLINVNDLKNSHLKEEKKFLFNER